MWELRKLKSLREKYNEDKAVISSLDVCFFVDLCIPIQKRREISIKLYADKKNYSLLFCLFDVIQFNVCENIGVMLQTCSSSEEIWKKIMKFKTKLFAFLHNFPASNIFN